MTRFCGLKSGNRKTRTVPKELDRRRFNVESMEDRCSLSAVAGGCLAAEVPPIPRPVDPPAAQIHRVADRGLVVIARPVNAGTPMLGDQGLSRPLLYEIRPVTAHCTPVFGGPQPELPDFGGRHPESPVLFGPHPQ